MTRPPFSQAKHRQLPRRGASARYRERDPLQGGRAPYWDPGDTRDIAVTDEDVEQHMNVGEASYNAGTTLIRDERGRFLRADSTYADSITDAAYWRLVERAFDARISTMTARGNRELGTYRSKRIADDLRRERDRIATCLVCGGSLDGKRAGAKTCSERCRKALARQRVHGVVKGDLRPTYAARLEVSMRINAPLMAELADFTEQVWDVPMPDAYPDEHDWRLGQAMALFGLARDERLSSRPSIARFRRRARDYIRHMNRLAQTSRKGASK